MIHVHVCTTNPEAISQTQCLWPDLHTLWVKGNDHVLMEDEEDIDWAAAMVPAAEGEVQVDK